MSWTDRMKNIIEHGIQTSADIAEKAGHVAIGAASALGSKASELGEQAASKAQDLGERGALTIENKKLEFEAGRLCTKLGCAVFDSLVVRGESSVSTETPAVSGIIEEIRTLNAKIEANEAVLKK